MKIHLLGIFIFCWYNFIRTVLSEIYMRNKNPVVNGIRPVVTKNETTCNILNLSNPTLAFIILKNSVRTSKRTQHFTVTKINWLMLFKEIIAV
jgi:hypothetical protein